MGPGLSPGEKTPGIGVCVCRQDAPKSLQFPGEISGDGCAWCGAGHVAGIIATIIIFMYYS